MRLAILHKQFSEHDTAMNGYVREFEHRYHSSIELLNADSRDGVAKMHTYDILATPCLLALRDNGQLLQLWPEFDKWPPISELSSYA